MTFRLHLQIQSFWWKTTLKHNFVAFFRKHARKARNYGVIWRKKQKFGMTLSFLRFFLQFSLLFSDEKVKSVLKAHFFLKNLNLPCADVESRHLQEMCHWFVSAFCTFQCYILRKKCVFKTDLVFSSKKCNEFWRKKRKKWRYWSKN